MTEAILQPSADNLQGDAETVNLRGVNIVPQSKSGGGSELGFVPRSDLLRARGNRFSAHLINVVPLVVETRPPLPPCSTPLYSPAHMRGQAMFLIIYGPTMSIRH